MDEMHQDILSTYQWITVGRILERYGVVIPEPSLMILLRAKTSFYYQLLHVPLTNILNGIIIDQAREYQLFLQKLFVDYLVSGEADKSKEEPGEDTRDALETQRQSMLALSEKFEEAQLAHQNLISESQRALIDFMQGFNQVLKACLAETLKIFPTKKITLNALQTLLLDAQGFQIQEPGWTRFEKAIDQTLAIDLRRMVVSALEPLNKKQQALDELLALYAPRVEESRVQLNQFRTAFYDRIPSVQSELQNISSYRVDDTQDAENRARLMFESDIGAEST